MSVVSQIPAKRFAALFAGYPDAYGQMNLDAAGKKVVRTVSSPIPDDAYWRHLSGDGPFLGIIPIRPDGTCYFGAIDLDDDNADHNAIEAEVVRLKLPLVVCRSKSGGAHLYCFGRELLDAVALVAALKRMRKLLGREKNPNGQGVEIFPKQVKVDGGQLGNWINLPYYDHEHTNRYAVRDGRRLTLDEFVEHALSRSVTAVDLQGVGAPGTGTFQDGPPCLEKLDVERFPEGTRNNGLFNAALYFKLKHGDEAWSPKLVQYNMGLPHPVDGHELKDVLRHVQNKGYLYTCKSEPLLSLCDKALCKKRVYGIARAMSDARQSSLPPLGSLVKVLTEPPRYKLTVGDQTITLASEQLQSSALFKYVVFEQLNLVVEQLKQSEWDEVMRGLLESMVEEPAPLDAGDRGLLLMFLKDFLLQRAKAHGVEDVLRGLPYADVADDRVYFRGSDFASFLQRRQFKRFAMNELYTVLAADAGLTFHDRMIKGAQTKLWAVPTPSDEQTEEFTYPPPPKMAPV